MNLLIGYDGSDCAEAALDDLRNAGLPSKGSAMIVTVAEVWLPPPNSEHNESRDETDIFVENILHKHRERAEQFLVEAEKLAEKATQRIRLSFPGWEVAAKATYGSPTWELLSAANEIEPDLIVVGSQGNSMFSQFILGSVSQKVLTEAACSVRVARGRVEVDPSPIRIMIGFDGSAGAMAAVEAVAKRSWPTQTVVRMVTATDSSWSSTIGELVGITADDGETDDSSTTDWIDEFKDEAANVLQNAGLDVETKVIRGNPNNILVEEAQAWHADCIFVGANAEGSRLERYLLGTTSAAVAARAHCSVEVVRR